MGKEKESVKSQGIVNSDGLLVWQKLIAFGGTEKFVPELIERVDVEGTGIGSIRTIHIKGGGEIIEKLTSINTDKMEMKFIIVATPMPIQNYEGIFTVTSLDDSTCSALFESIYDVLPEQKAEMYNAIKNFQTAFISNLHK